MKGDILEQESGTSFGTTSRPGGSTKQLVPYRVSVHASSPRIGHLLPFLVDFARFQTYRNGPNVVFLRKATCQNGGV
jgi:hypothetical protein